MTKEELEKAINGTLSAAELKAIQKKHQDKNKEV